MVFDKVLSLFHADFKPKVNFSPTKVQNKPEICHFKPFEFVKLVEIVNLVIGFDFCR